MLLLGIETATPIGSLALLENEQVIIERELIQKGNHSSELLPTLNEMINELALNLHELKAIAVSKGPGSFTGLRIGISIAKGLAFSLKIPLVGVPTLDALAWNLVDLCTCFGNNLICPVLDARKKQVYTALYKKELASNKLKIFTDYLVVYPDELVGIIKQQENFDKIIFLGNGLDIYRDFFKDSLGDMAEFVFQEQNLLRASNIALLGLMRLKEAASGSRAKVCPQVLPLYIRQSVA